MIEKILCDVKKINYKRVIGIGGGSVLDIAKLLVLKEFSSISDLFEKKITPEKDKELILIPTTCGTGSEVTNITIAKITKIHSKFGLAHDSLYANNAVLIPFLLNEMPYEVFASSSLDALVHAVESYLSDRKSVV